MRKNPRKFHLKQLFQLFGLGILLISIVAGITQIKVVRDFFSSASGEKANLIIDVQAEQGPLSKPWQYLAQGGEDHAWNMQPIVPKVKALEPKYIRIDHVYDFYDIVSRDGGNQLQFNFSKLDPLLDSILATGAKPFIVLSYMPPAIAKTDIVSEPNNWSDWQLTVQRTIEHISGKRGIADVYYEVWNEPDLFGKWHYSGQKNYLTMYTYSSRGATQAKGVKPFKLGGPGTTGLYKNWFTALTDHATKNNLRYDFFSWHRYNLKVEEFQDDIRDIRTWQTGFPQTSSLELLITEWGHDSENHTGYDNNFGAAHTVAGAIELVGTVEKAFIFEIEDGKDPAGNAKWGRWGMLTHQSFGAEIKPRYQAVRMLNQLGPTRVSAVGDGNWVKALASKDAENRIITIVANYDSAGRNTEVVPVTFRNVIPGDYSLEQQFLGGRQQINTLTSSGSFLNTTVTMPANSVVLLKLSKKDQTATPSGTIKPLSTAIPTVTLPPTPSPTPSLPQTGFGRLLN